ncbi:MAG: tetratricopeptide repeat protein [Vampirovibrionales bacterium]|nr:tetratricopeptide repeat protein [Vampirovibrionales bacterium]
MQPEQRGQFWYATPPGKAYQLNQVETSAPNTLKEEPDNDFLMPRTYQNGTQLLSIQSERSSGNLILQTSGRFVSPSLDTTGWPNNIKLVLSNATLDEAFEAPDADWLENAREVFPQLVDINVSPVQLGQQAQVQILIQFKDIETGSLPPHIVSNTGSLLSLSFHKPSSSAAQVSVKNQPLPIAPLTQNTTQGKKQDSAPSLYQYFNGLPTPPAQTPVTAGENTTTVTETAKQAEEPKVIDGLVQKAWSDYLAGRYSNVILSLRPYVDRVSDDAGARYLLAAAYTASGESSGAERELKALLLQNQESLPLVLDVIRLKLQQSPERIGKDNELAKLIDQALKKWPDHPELRASQAQVALAGGRLDEAKQLIAQAMRNGVSPEYFTLLGDIELKQGNRQAARIAYLDALTVTPNQSEARKKLGFLDALEQNQEAALENYAKVLPPSWLLDYATLLEQNQQKEEALAVLKVADMSLAKAHNSASYVQSDSQLPMFYELGMRFADFRENVDAQRNLKRFVDLSAYKQYAVGSLEEKQLSSARETLKLLEGNPATNKSGSLTSKKTTNKTIERKTPEKKPAEKKPATTSSEAEKPAKTEKAKQPPVVAPVKVEVSRPSEKPTNVPANAPIDAPPADVPIVKKTEKTQSAAKPVQKSTPQAKSQQDAVSKREARRQEREAAAAYIRQRERETYLKQKEAQRIRENLKRQQDQEALKAPANPSTPAESKQPEPVKATTTQSESKQEIKTVISTPAPAQPVPSDTSSAPQQQTLTTQSETIQVKRLEEKPDTPTPSPGNTPAGASKPVEADADITTFSENDNDWDAEKVKQGGVFGEVQTVQPVKPEEVPEDFDPIAESQKLHDQLKKKSKKEQKPENPKKEEEIPANEKIKRALSQPQEATQKDAERPQSKETPARPTGAATIPEAEAKPAVEVTPEPTPSTFSF